MSLQAKVEAVIYAAEEPVTLAQLVQLFGAEALELRASRLGQPLPALPFAGQDAPALPLAGEGSPEDPQPHQEGATEPAEATQDSPAEEEDGARLTRLRERQAREELRRVLSELTDLYATEDRGLELREVAGGFRFATKPQYHDAVRGFIRTLKPPLKLSLAALETLAVIAYKQPITSPEITDVRGVESTGVLGSLIARKLVTTAGRKAVIGRPILYKTTREFLLRFGLKDLNELPSMEEFERMAATELTEPDPASELNGDTPMTEGATTAADEAPEQQAPEHADPEAASRAQAEISVAEEQTPEQDLPGVTRDTHGQLPIQSSPATLIRRPPEEDEAI